MCNVASEGSGFPLSFIIRTFWIESKLWKLTCHINIFKDYVEKIIYNDNIYNDIVKVNIYF